MESVATYHVISLKKEKRKKKRSYNVDKLPLMIQLPIKMVSNNIKYGQSTTVGGVDPA
jgi:hypothetical protein